MHKIRKSLVASGSHVCSAKTILPQWSTLHFSRQISASACLWYTNPSKENIMVSPHQTDETPKYIQNQSRGRTEDAFSDPNAIQEAKERWGLGATVFAHVIYPNGRAEIADQTRKLTEARISSGHSGWHIPRNRQVKSTLDPGENAVIPTPSTMPNPHLHQMSRDGSTELMPQWMKHKLTIKKKLLGKAWNPQRKLTKQSMEEVRFLHKQFPDEWTTPKLAEHFNVASESIVRILKTNFQLSPERIAEQDKAKRLRRKENISADVERIKARRHSAWLERKAEREKSRKSSSPASSRIKLGAPVRTIE
ncbi:Required for respiratory growth protein 9 mitochondrial [Entomortierella chlamydospora]|nr:Required for respiratory growth protein 9 mitochondrial [Entomortierella chlamydospora]